MIYKSKIYVQGIILSKPLCNPFRSNLSKKPTHYIKHVFNYFLSFVISTPLILPGVHKVFEWRVKNQKVVLEAAFWKPQVFWKWSEHSRNAQKLGFGKTFQRWETKHWCRGKMSFKKTVSQMVKLSTRSFYCEY